MPPWLVVAVVALFLQVATLAGAFLILRRRWSAPTRRLTAAVEPLARGQWDLSREDRIDDPEEGAAPPLRDLATHLTAIATRAAQQLADRDEQRRVMQVLVDTLPDPVLLVEGHRRVTLINSAAGRLLGVPATTATSRWLGEIVKDRPLLEIFDAVPPAGAATSLAPVQRELKLPRDNQHLTYQAVATPTADGVLLVLRDVTALAETVRIKTDFVANASHELRTPVAAIKAAFDTLRDCYADDPHQTSRCVEIIDGHVARLEALLRDLLDLSRLESPDVPVDLAPVRPQELFATLRQTFAASAAQKQLTLVTESTVESFTSDRRLLDLVLKNLVENAVKFTPAGGTVTVSAAASSDPRSVTLTVSDTGIGIPPEHQPRVFERFYQVDPSRTSSSTRGTGLGLSIVKHAVSALGGSLSLESRVGQGTTLTCTLPQETVEEHRDAEKRR